MVSRRKNKRLSMVGYADVLHCVANGPVTRAEVINRMRIARTTAWRILGTLHHMRIIHVAEWVAREHAPYMPSYAIGDLPDAPMPSTRPNGKPCEAINVRGPSRATLSSEGVSFAVLLRSLEQPASVADLEAATGLFERTIRRVIGRLRELDMVFIAEWERRAYGGGLPIANYQFGIGRRDKPMPAPIGRPTANRRYREARAAREAQQFIDRALASSATHPEEAHA